MVMIWIAMITVLACQHAAQMLYDAGYPTNASDVDNDGQNADAQSSHSTQGREGPAKEERQI